MQQRSRGSRGSGNTFDGGTAYSHLSASDHRRKDAQCIRYASGGSVATRTCVGLQRGLPGRRRAWQVQVALNRCYYMLNRRRRLTSATPSVLGDAIWLRCGECGAGSRCMQDLMKRGEKDRFAAEIPLECGPLSPAEIAMYLVLSPSVISARVVSARSRPLGHGHSATPITVWYDTTLV